MLNFPESRKSAANGRQFAVCVDNSGHAASLERNKIYVGLPDKEAESDGTFASSTRGVPTFFHQAPSPSLNRD